MNGRVYILARRSERNESEALVSQHSQFLRDEEEAEALRRVFAHCNGGPCQGGRKPCPSPEACQTVESEVPGPKPSRRWALALGVFVVMLLAALMFGRPHQ